MNKTKLWTEKYKPYTIEECIIPDRIKSVIKGYLQKENLPHFIFYSVSPGTSKSSVAKVIINELQADYMFINASDESSKSAFLEKVIPFVSSVSMVDSNAPKIVFADEFCRANNMLQDSMKSHLELHSDNARFILTANSFNRIIEPIKSRCTCIDFTPEKSEYPSLMQQVFKRCSQILKENSIEFDKEVLAQFINSKFPDFRRIINGLQTYSTANGKIDKGILKNIEHDNISTMLYDLIKAKKFTELRKFSSENIYSFDDYVSILFSGIDKLQKNQIPIVIVLLNEYSYKSAFVANQKIALLSLFVELIDALSQ